MSREGIGKFVVYFGVLIGIISSLYLIGSAFRFWAYGVSNSAHIIGLERIQNGNKGRKSYYYKIDIDGAITVQRFGVEVPVESNIPVITLDKYPRGVIVGRKNDNFFQVFSSYLGSKYLAYMFLAFYGYMAWLFVRHFAKHTRRPC